MKIFIIVINFILATSSLAQSSVVKKTNKNFIDHVHSILSQDILSVANNIDNFFGTERADDEANSTRIRLYMITNKNEGKPHSTEGNIKLQLVLPRTQKRLQLVVEGDDDNDDQNQSNVTGGVNNQTSPSNRSAGTQGVAQKAAQATTAALRFITETAGIRTSFDAGLRFTSQPQLFYRMRFRKNVMFKQWAFRPVEQIKWTQDEGHSSNTDLDFDRKLGGIWSFRFQNNIFWNDQDYTVTLTNGPSWFQTINERMGLSYNLRINSQNSPQFLVTNYISSIGFRQLLYKKWFFWTITPALNFPREENFHRTPSLTLRFDVILGSI